MKRCWAGAAGAALMAAAGPAWASQAMAAGLEPASGSGEPVQAVRARGGDCFVRSARGDRPMQWASRPRGNEPV